MIKIKIKDHFQISENGFIILHSGVRIQILTNHLTIISQFYGHPMTNVLIVNDSFNHLNIIPNHYYLSMDPHRFALLEKQCLKDLINYDYKIDHYDGIDYLHKIPKNVNIMIKEKLYDESILIIYFLIKKYLIIDISYIIIENLLQVYINDYESYIIV